MDFDKMQRWIMITKDPLRLKEMYENDQIQICTTEHINKGNKILVYRSGNQRDVKCLYQVVNSEKFYGKNKITLKKEETFQNSLKLSEMHKDLIISNWRKKFIKEFNEVPFRPWNRIIGLVSKNNPHLFKKHNPKCCSGPNSKGFPVNYKNALFNLIKQVKNYRNRDFNEETTKQLVVIPILRNLGWNTYNICEVHPEHQTHYKSQRADYVLNDYQSGQVCIEVKKIGEKDLDKHVIQLMKYCAFRAADIGILTNGLVWRFYRVPFHSKPLRAIKIPKMVEIDILNNNDKEIYNTFIQYLWNGKISQKPMLPIEKPSIKEINKIIKSLSSEDRFKYNEEAMKQGIVLPILENLGWDVSNPSEIIFEKSNSNIKSKKVEKIDYILGCKKENILVEVKGLTYKFPNIDTDNDSQLIDYLKYGKYNFGVLTNGIYWHFYQFRKGKFQDYYELDLREKYSIKKLKSLLSRDIVLNGKYSKNIEKLHV